MNFSNKLLSVLIGFLPLAAVFGYLSYAEEGGFLNVNAFGIVALFVAFLIGLVLVNSIVKRGQIEKKLSENSRQFEDILGSLREVVWSVSLADGKLAYVSPAAESVYGRPIAEFYETPNFWFADAYPEDRGIIDKFERELDEKKIAEAEFRIAQPNGEARWIHTRARVVADGAARRIDGISMDVTLRRMLEDQLRQAQKLESVGQLAAGIAHEINTPLQYVGDNTRFLRDAFADLTAALDKQNELANACRLGLPPAALLAEVDKTMRDGDVEYLLEEVPAALSQSLEGIERVTRIVQSMKDFAHPGSGEMKAVDLNKAIESTAMVARNEWKYVADLNLDFDANLPPVTCMVGEINQVVLNMIINAAHTIKDVVGDGGEKGKITVETRGDADWAEIRISDTGRGIPEEIQAKIFDPFFTTKEVGKGTGQGLAISHRVVARHEGSLSFETEPGRGTTFIIRLPVGGAQAQPKAASAVAAAA